MSKTTFALPSGKQVTLSRVGGEISIGINGAYFGSAFAHAIRSSVPVDGIFAIPGKGRMMVPVDARPAVLALVAASASESRRCRQAELEAAYHNAKHAAATARESACRVDTGHGFGGLAALDAAAEAARLELVAFGGEYGSETDEARD